MKKKFYLLVLVCFFTTPVVFADIFIEPLISYTLGSGEIEGKSADYKGPLFGGKIGLRKLGVSVGGRFDFGRFSAEEAQGRTVDTPHRAYGVFVGLDLPLVFRTSFSYFLSSSQNVEYPSPQKEVERDGTGYAIQVGVGFSFIAKIFVEYQKHTYDRDDSSDKDDVTWYMAGISLPIGL